MSGLFDALHCLNRTFDSYGVRTSCELFYKHSIPTGLAEIESSQEPKKKFGMAMQRFAEKDLRERKGDETQK